ncbi:xaa-pro dipeptidase [Lacticaseibacillus thailandensis DSM 22698 = JCM 13996]|uniref:Xaa-pro dipeptidase n=2 Tax=Lacticaseibacillus thailandensis TaxID=381741 RepID=A0A0R2CHZ5_9LACO|nr:xaa-pro dipeptidase [Lacticaseibacillus thailandensis DSM 22698 = JCM 13996]
MKENNLDGFLINSKANQYYLSGFTGSYGQVLITQTGQYVIADGRYFEQLKTQSPEFTVVDNHMRMNETVRDLVLKQNCKNLGIEEEEMDVAEYLTLTNGNNLIHLLPTRDWIEGQRMVKDTEERDKIREAGKIADATFQHILNYIEPGMTEKQVANEIDQWGLDHGADARSFETIVASGIRSALPHGHASNKIIGTNEMIILDFGFEKDRYFSDITRTIALGHVDPELKQIYDVTQTAQKKAIQASHEGVPLKELDRAARDYIDDAGYGDKFLHGTGHGLGLTVHEYPLLNRDSTETLTKHMTYTVEPGIYLEGIGGVRIEDDVWINDQGEPELMTQSPLNMIEI